MPKTMRGQRGGRADNRQNFTFSRGKAAFKGVTSGSNAARDAKRALEKSRQGTKRGRP
jgi:hypothetical protein